MGNICQVILALVVVAAVTTTTAADEYSYYAHFYSIKRTYVCAVSKQSKVEGQIYVKECPCDSRSNKPYLVPRLSLEPDACPNIQPHKASD